MPNACLNNKFISKGLVAFGLFTLLFILAHGLSRPSFAQFPEFGVATTYQITDKNIDDGDIVSLSPTKNALNRSTTSYDDKMYGVYIKSPKVVYREPSSKFPIIRNGEARVNVTSLSGPIKKGDYVTSSEIIGKGQKAKDLTGYILGIALTDFPLKSGKDVTYEGKKYKVGSILVSVGIGPASAIQVRGAGGLLGIVAGLGSQFLVNFQTSKEFSRLMRYIIAALIAVTAIFINFFTFGRNITQGIEAIGRNPLAKLSIQSMIIVNVILIAILSLAAVGLALVIIAF